MTRRDRERRQRQIEEDADHLVALLGDPYPYFLQVQRERCPGAEDWPLEKFLCFVWSFWERLIVPEIREAAKARFWEAGQRQIEAERHRRVPDGPVHQ